MTTPSPLERYLRVQRATDRELAVLLGEAATEAEKLVLRLAGDNVGDVIRRAQYQMIINNLRLRQAELWPGRVRPAVARGMAAAVQAAVDGQNAVRRVLLRAVGQPTGPLFRAMEAQSQETLRTLLARGANNIPLSAQVYRTEAWASGLVNRRVNLSILMGQSWRELADGVRDLIDPATRGGVSYAAKRLGRTELNNAFHTTNIDQAQRDPWNTGVQWHLSGTHPRSDECDDLANSTHFRGGDPGVFRPDDVPRKPHPQCLCFITTVSVSRDEFVRAYVRGDYDQFLIENSL